MDKLAEARKVFDIEIEALKKTRDALDESFVQILDLMTACKGKVIITGMGKPGHIGTKIAATLASLGTPSFYLHPGEAMHGDLGMVTKDDIVIMISYSGESDEIVRIIPNIKMMGAKLVAITGNPESTLAKAADLSQIFPKFEEACYLGLAPTSSTTVTLCYGDALAVVASGVIGYTKSDYGKRHPAGSLGKKLILRVQDLMARGKDAPIVSLGTSLMKTIEEMSKKGLGIVTVTDEKGELQGILTDGDLRRVLERRVDIYSEIVDNVMIRTPFTVESDVLAVDALVLIRSKSINSLPVIDKGKKVVGAITWQNIVKAGIVI